jgi:uncharacterized repeat protein (TIGR01451 family)
MKFLAHIRILTLVVVALIAAGLRSEAQVPGFGFSVTSSVGSLAVSNSVTYNIGLSNFTGTVLEATLVTNALPSSVEILSATTAAGYFTNFGNVVVFYLGSVPVGEVVQMSVVAEPTAIGLVTNSVSVFVANLAATNIFTTNVVVDVTNVVTDADLSVAVTGPTQPVITNDWMTYGITVSNAGPSAAPNVVLTNYIPPVGFILEKVFPTNLFGIVDTTNSIVYLSLGTIPDGGSTNIQFTLQAPIAGTLTFTSTVGSVSITDTNLTNNFAITNITVLDPLPGLFIAVTNSAQAINLQNGLEEQSVLLFNLGATTVPAARVVVSGLPKQLYNAVGTNSGNPFVTLAAPLSPGQSVNLLLQYNPRGSFPFTNNELQAYGVPFPNLTPPIVTATSASINLNGIFKLSDGNMLIEFPATTGQTYTVVYSDNAQFSNAMIAPPAIIAPANEVQWIDYGPPTTVSAPANSNARFYRVLQDP